MTDRQADVAASRRWLPLLLLLASALIATVIPLFPVVRAADGSASGAAIGTAWLSLIPVAAALVAQFVRVELGIAVIAGVGTVAVGRLLADLGLLFSPDAVLRPEWFGVQSVSAFPLTATWSSALPVVADALAIAAVWAAGRTVLDGYEPPRLEADPTDRGGVVRAFRATPFTLLGIVAAGLVIASSLGVLYGSPIPVVRPLGLADIGLFGAAGAALGGLVLCLLVVVASVLPPMSARGLMIGAGVGSAVPPLIAILAGGPTRPAALAWVGLIGAVLLGLTGLLIRSRATPTEEASPESTATGDIGFGDVAPVSMGRSVALGVVALAAAGCALLAYTEPQATSQLVAAGSSFDAAGAGFLAAAIVLALGGAAALAPPVSRWARLWLGLAWAPAAAALLGSLEFTSSSIWVSTAIYSDAAGVERSSGSWWGVAAVGLAVIAAIYAPLLSARIRDASPAQTDPADELDRPSARTITAATLTLFVLIAYALPVYDASGRPSAALFTAGSRIDSYGAWLTVIALVVAIWVACRERSRPAAVVILVASAAVAGCRIVLTPAVRHQLDFTLDPGFYVGVALVAVLLVAAGLLAVVINAAPIAEPGFDNRPRTTVGAPRPKGPRPKGPTSAAPVPKGKRR